MSCSYLMTDIMAKSQSHPFFLMWNIQTMMLCLRLSSSPPLSHLHMQYANDGCCQFSEGHRNLKCLRKLHSFWSHIFFQLYCSQCERLQRSKTLVRLVGASIVRMNAREFHGRWEMASFFYRLCPPFAFSYCTHQPQASPVLSEHMLLWDYDKKVKTTG